ncbi:hypothetical protein, unlikely [Trypanosoma brucei gambiense DAL972]|uniref:T. brucei spp.-specific protein n=1 Tax=Trypanosoma brucei gambiense (strain MHOM/CI/86/DAL972) TaxID=679716 RepID=D0A4E0_TRYB9|nr:hypothetical protein, unlikely [Trypanosoma brucei gambiense DAL972]CBH16134.1 hypothetical protein, unlikely [Trypanosoma brucei gambiense DAL972]|eukprot:XP_011778398.1 hypothetical protein, unlikely [Trypanosoma brucei gambiense DAL972]
MPCDSPVSFSIFCFLFFFSSSRGIAVEKGYQQSDWRVDCSFFAALRFTSVDISSACAYICILLATKYMGAIVSLFKILQAFMHTHTHAFPTDFSPPPPSNHQQKKYPTINRVYFRIAQYARRSNEREN